MAEKDEKYQQTLNRLAFQVSHRFRKPISTMLGLICLIERDLLSAEECQRTFQTFKTCLDDLDKSSRELVTFIHEEQVSSDR